MYPYHACFTVKVTEANIYKGKRVYDGEGEDEPLGLALTRWDEDCFPQSATRTIKLWLKLRTDDNERTTIEFNYSDPLLRWVLNHKFWKDGDPELPEIEVGFDIDNNYASIITFDTDE